MTAVATAPAYYVRSVSATRSTWTGPMPRGDAEQQAAARRTQGWTAWAVPDTPQVRAEVRTWLRCITRRREGAPR